MIFLRGTIKFTQFVLTDSYTKTRGERNDHFAHIFFQFIDYNNHEGFQHLVVLHLHVNLEGWGEGVTFTDK